MLSNLRLRTAYHKGLDDIAGDFYNPCLRAAIKYDRAVGYFRSSIYLLTWPALRDFIASGGRIRILCSHELGAKDVEAIEAGYTARIDALLADHYRHEVESIFRDPVLKAPWKLLAALVANKYVDVRIALLPQSQGRSRRLFHDKLGLFTDSKGDSVMFRGSMNESWSGLAKIFCEGNLESIDVAATWLGDRDRMRVDEEREYFEMLWADRYPQVSVREFPDVPRSILVANAADDWEEYGENLANDHLEHSAEGEVLPLRPHQGSALAGWHARGRRGIFEHATGSGKTFTAMHAIADALKRDEAVLILVPDTTLLEQWRGEVTASRAVLGTQVDLLTCGGGDIRWKKPGVLRSFTRKGLGPRIVISTLATAVRPTFIKGLEQGSHLLVVADEVHRTGSPERRQLFQISAGPRLGLSATPRRVGDPEGTRALFEYFGDVVPPPFGLKEAIDSGVLSRYFYRPHVVHLNETEASTWNLQTRALAKLFARKFQGDKSPQLRERIRIALIERARIAKKARSKIELACEVIAEHFVTGQRWIVYSDDLSQLRDVRSALAERGVKTFEYHSKMTGSREQTLRWLDRVGGIVVSIRCLDEGVNIPSVGHALILASSKNPREYIQRRGRVLRGHVGKGVAWLHDALVVPPRPEGDEEPDPLVISELARAIQFAATAENTGAANDLEVIAIEWGLDWHELAEQGVEDDDETDEDDEVESPQ